jgi:hypothetical protein
MTVSLAPLWTALDQIPQATTDTLEWKSRLGGAWSIARVFLRPVGTLATEVDCPSPGNDGCPRKIVKHADGRLRAVCGNSSAHCDAIDVTAEDIEHLTLDRTKLVSAVLDALNAETGAAGNLVVGNYPVVAGVGIPIAFFVPGPAEVAIPRVLTPPAAILVPTPNSLSNELVQQLQDEGHVVLALSNTMEMNDQHQLINLISPELLLATACDRILDAVQPAAQARVWVLPPDTRWEMLKFEFIDADRLSVRFQQQTRVFQPDQFGMKNKITGKARYGWALLLIMADLGGKTPHVPEKKRPALEKQKQLLGDRLKDLFGIDEEPFYRDRDEQTYVARFSLRDGRPKAARQKDF